MKKDSAVTEAVGFIFVLAAVLIIVSLFLVYGVPVLEEKKTADETDAVLLQFSAIQSGMDELYLTKAYGIERNIMLPAETGTVVLNLASEKERETPFTLSYETPSGTDIVFEGGTISQNGMKISSSPYIALAERASSRDMAVMGKTAVFSVTLRDIITRDGMPYAIFSVRLV